MKKLTKLVLSLLFFILILGVASITVQAQKDNDTMETWQEDKTDNTPSRIKIIGKWRGSFVIRVISMITIINKGGHFLLNMECIDNSKSSEKLIEKRIKGKRCFFKQNSKFGEYFIINSNGSLSIYDDEGLITTLKSY